MISVNDNNFNHLVLGSSRPTLVAFGAPWCGLCHFLKPLLERMGQEWGEELMIAEVNADINLRLANAYRLKNLPTLILFRQGRVVNRLENFRQREDLHRIQQQLAVSLEYRDKNR